MNAQHDGLLITWAWTIGISVTLTIVSTATVVVRQISGDRVFTLTSYHEG